MDLCQVAVEQKKDTECQQLFLKAKDQNSKDIMRMCVIKHDVLLRSVTVAKAGQRFQLLVPTNLKEVFLSYAHDNPQWSLRQSQNIVETTIVCVLVVHTYRCLAIL